MKSRMAILLISGLMYDEFVKSQKAPVIVIPANAGIQENQPFMDSRVRGSDGFGDFLRGHQDCLRPGKKGQRASK